MYTWLVPSETERKIYKQIDYVRQKVEQAAVLVLLCGGVAYAHFLLISGAQETHRKNSDDFIWWLIFPVLAGTIIDGSIVLFLKNRWQQYQENQLVRNRKNETHAEVRRSFFCSIDDNNCVKTLQSGESRELYSDIHGWKITICVKPRTDHCEIHVANQIQHITRSISWGHPTSYIGITPKVPLPDPFWDDTEKSRVIGLFRYFNDLPIVVSADSTLLFVLERGGNLRQIATYIRKNDTDKTLDAANYPATNSSSLI